MSASNAHALAGVAGNTRAIVRHLGGSLDSSITWSFPPRSMMMSGKSIDHLLRLRYRAIPTWVGGERSPPYAAFLALSDNSTWSQFFNIPSRVPSLARRIRDSKPRRGNVMELLFPFSAL